MGHLQVRNAADFDCFSFDGMNPVMKKDDVKNDIDNFDIEFLVHPISKDNSKCVLLKCGKAVTFYHVTPALIGEVKLIKDHINQDVDSCLLYKKDS